MSSALAIAATTAVIKSILESGLVRADLNLSSVLSTFSVSALPPDRVQTTPTEPNQLNLFMYQATLNAGWRNVDLPSRDARGERIANPPLALDLHYMLCAYGSADLHAEMLLGVGMHLLHELPVLTREAIRKVFTPTGGGSLPGVMQALATSGIADQIEIVRICPAPLSTDDLSKLWTAFQDKYRPCAAYTASVVLIETKAPATSALPVREPVLLVTPLLRPTIDRIEPPLVTFAANVSITLHGTDLLGTDTKVRFGSGAEVDPDPESVGSRLTVPLPAGINAGITTAQVVLRVPLGDPAIPHRGFESNVAAFVVRPVIAMKDDAGQQVPDIDVNTTGAGTDPRSGTITARLQPVVGKRQRARLLLSEVRAADDDEDRPNRAYTFDAPSRDQPDQPDTSPVVDFPVSGLIAGTYLARVQIDGADSELTRDPATGVYAGPTVSVP
jgi:hypothetical protein